MRIPSSRVGQWLLAVLLAFVVWGIPALSSELLMATPIGRWFGVPGACLGAILFSFALSVLANRMFPP